MLRLYAPRSWQALRLAGLVGRTVRVRYGDFSDPGAAWVAWAASLAEVGFFPAGPSEAMGSQARERAAFVTPLIGPEAPITLFACLTCVFA